MSLILLLAFVVLLLGYWHFQYIRPRKHPPLPPGPKGFWRTAYARDFPAPGSLEYRHWLMYHDIYEPISSIQTWGHTIVILNDATAALDLLGKRAIYASRPRQVFAGEMVGWDRSVALSPDCELLRSRRKHVMRLIGSQAAVAKYQWIQEQEAGRFLQNVLRRPDQVIDHIQRETSAIIIRIVYGYEPDTVEINELIELARKVTGEFAEVGVPGKFLVDFLPFLRYLPEWIPGTSFKQVGRECRRSLNALAEKPFHYTTQSQIITHKRKGCILSELLHGNHESNTESESVTKWTALSLHTAGADTTASSLEFFFVAMMNRPEVQDKAHEEIDQVIGQERLPGTNDAENLPYVAAVVKEVLRWQPVTPMGLPHTSKEAEVYRGFFIPRGSTILPNIWYFMHDPMIYADPFSFKPERFLPVNDEKIDPDPSRFAFGFGRRMCPGRILAQSSLFITVAQCLAVMNIKKPDRGESGGEPPQPMPGVVTHPDAVQCCVEARSPQHYRLLWPTAEPSPRELASSLP